MVGRWVGKRYASGAARRHSTTTFVHRRAVCPPAPPPETAKSPFVKPLCVLFFCFILCVCGSTTQDLKATNDNLKALQMELEKAYQTQSAGVASSGTLTAILETKDARIATLEKEVGLLEQELDRMRLYAGSPGHALDRSVQFAAAPAFKHQVSIARVPERPHDPRHDRPTYPAHPFSWPPLVFHRVHCSILFIVHSTIHGPPCTFTIFGLSVRRAGPYAAIKNRVRGSSGVGREGWANGNRSRSPLGCGW